VLPGDQAYAPDAEAAIVSLVVHDLSMADESLSVTFGSLQDVKALHRMVMNRKFDGPDDDFFGSPQLAAAQNAIFEALVRAEPQKASQWLSWRNARRHELVLDRVRQHLQDHRELITTMEPAARRSYVESLLAPLTADPELLAELANGQDSAG
jgi:hypothetical protein